MVSVTTGACVCAVNTPRPLGAVEGLLECRRSVKEIVDSSVWRDPLAHVGDICFQFNCGTRPCTLVLYVLVQALLKEISVHKFLNC